MFANLGLCMKLGMFFPVVFLQVIIACLVIGYFRFCVLEMLSLVGKGICGTLFVMLFTLMEGHYFKAVFTDPGEIHQEWSVRNLNRIKFRSAMERNEVITQWPQEAERIPAVGEMVRGQNFSFCFTCKKVRPERAHHCDTCERCCLKMDHHCGWVANCIGLNNHKFFIIFLLYAFVLSTLMLVTILDAIFDLYYGKRKFNIVFFNIIYIQLRCGVLFILSIFSTAYVVSSLGMLIFQIFLLLHNRTVYECQMRSKNEKDHYSVQNWIGNLKETLGEHPFLWLFPVHPQFKHTGHEYNKSANEILTPESIELTSSGSD